MTASPASSLPTSFRYQDEAAPCNKQNETNPNIWTQLPLLAFLDELSLIAVMSTCRSLFVAGLNEKLWGHLFSQRFKLVPKAGQVLPTGRLHRATAATSAGSKSVAAPAARTASGLESALQQTSAPLNLKALLYDARAFSRFRSWVHKPLLPRVPLAAGMPFVAASLRHPALAGDDCRTPGMHVTVAVHHRDGCILPSLRLLHSSAPAEEAAHGNVLDRQAAQAGEAVQRCLQVRAVIQNTHATRRYTLDLGRTTLKLRTGEQCAGEVDRLAFCDAKAVAPQPSSPADAGDAHAVPAASSVYTFTLRHNDTLSMVLSFPLTGVRNEAAALERCHSIHIPTVAHGYKQRVKLAALPQCSCAGGHFDTTGAQIAHQHTHDHDHSHAHAGQAGAEHYHPHAEGVGATTHAGHPPQYAQRSVPGEAFELDVPFVESDVVWSHYRYISGHFLVLEEKDLVSGV